MKYQAYETNGQQQRPLGIPRLGMAAHIAHTQMGASEIIVISALAYASRQRIQSDHGRQET